MPGKYHYRKKFKTGTNFVCRFIRFSRCTCGMECCHAFNFISMKAKILLLFICVAVAFASCTTDSEPAPQYAKAKLMEKKWYRIGQNGKDWRIYKQDGNWEDSSGDYGSWSLVNGNLIRINATKSLMGSWEENVLELTDSYLKTRMKGTTIALEYELTP